MAACPRGAGSPHEESGEESPGSSSTPRIAQHVNCASQGSLDTGSDVRVLFPVLSPKLLEDGDGVPTTLPIGLHISFTSEGNAGAQHALQRASNGSLSKAKIMKPLPEI